MITYILSGFLSSCSADCELLVPLRAQVVLTVPPRREDTAWIV